MLPTQNLPLYYGSRPESCPHNHNNLGQHSHLLVAVGNISDLIPGEGAFGCEAVVWLVDVQTQRVHSQQKIRSLLILKHISGVNRTSIDRNGLWWLGFPETFVNIEIKDSRLTFSNVCLLKTRDKVGKFAVTHWTQCATELDLGFYTTAGDSIIWNNTAILALELRRKYMKMVSL